MNVKHAKRIQKTDRKRKSRKKYRNYDGNARYVCLETPKRGKCLCCSNPRKYGKGKDKLTIQERRQDS